MKPPFRLAALLLVGVGISCGCHSSPPREPAPRSPVTQLTDAPSHTTRSEASSTNSDPLVVLNKLFLDAYKTRQAFVRSNTSPLIVADFSTLTLYWNGVAETNHSIPPAYHALKAVAHVPFGIYLRVDACSRTNTCLLPGSVVSDLESCLESIRAAETSLPNAALSSGQIARQYLILKDCKAYLTNVVATGKAPRRELLSFAHKVAPLMLANANDAAAAQLDMTHAAVMGWKSRIPPEEWKRLVVVV